jgi:hypothetical protein
MGEKSFEIINEIGGLSEKEREGLFDTLREIYPEQFLPKNAFVVGSNYDFWLNEKDDIYDRL